MDKTVKIEGKTLTVTFLGGKPWYVTMVLPSGFIRTIWHRDNNRNVGPLAAKAIAA